MEKKQNLTATEDPPIQDVGLWRHFWERKRVHGGKTRENWWVLSHEYEKVKDDKGGESTEKDDMTGTEINESEMQKLQGEKRGVHPKDKIKHTEYSQTLRLSNVNRKPFFFFQFLFQQAY